jgi:hypothetical protein
MAAPEKIVIPIVLALFLSLPVATCENVYHTFLTFPGPTTTIVYQHLCIFMRPTLRAHKKSVEHKFVFTSLSTVAFSLYLSSFHDIFLLNENSPNM